ncbi:MAG: IS200/IS605 family transposase [Acidobacteriia bacterium]|nr:IS200/IS605 family transposase [Terriglobia bacterium]
MSHTFTNLLTHAIFSTKNRIPMIVSDIKPRLHAYMGGIIRELHGKPITIGGTTDHVHLLIQLPPILAPAEAIQKLKANSSRWVNETLRLRTKFAWQEGYAGFSVSLSNVPKVVRYILNQEQHHRRKTFQEEMREFLTTYGIAFEESSVWK